jgi:O-antigen biosynthesis protein
MLEDRLALPAKETIQCSTDTVRPTVKGKFIFLGDEKFYVRGATFGPFNPEKHGDEYSCPEIVQSDFAKMSANGVNSVRTYTVPPRWFLDLAYDHGLRVMIGLPWEQHVTFLDHKSRVASIEERVRAGVRSCAGHPAILCYAIGNEIPASIVRWYGHGRVERFLKRLYRAAKSEDPAGLVTYVNYPTTEYLQPTHLDFVCFNVYLERRDRLSAYLCRLQNLAGNAPLVMAEIGLDSQRNGVQAQAEALSWQIATAFEAGCAGAFVFSWTDEWHRGGYDIEDWDFGLTTRDRGAKPALTAVREAFTSVPVRCEFDYPRISVVVCSYNGSPTIRECCEGLQELDYPDYEVIIVDDGSTDNTGEIAQRYRFRYIRTENKGLSSARNTGLAAATGEMVAYLDDDACPDPQWLKYLAAAFRNSNHAGIGGPNITPASDGSVAQCVSNAPGNPIHVLVSDLEAEHIPGCNMAFKRAALNDVGGFDPTFRIAGDDVDLCWRLQSGGSTLGFSPGAAVWHHRRNSVRAFWKQQLNYGKAEALLEMKWPEKYNALGHLTWGSQLYGTTMRPFSPLRRWRVYYGVWGSRLFQSVYEAAPGTLFSLPLMPEWYLIIGALGIFAGMGFLWAPLFWTLPVLVMALGVSVAQAGFNAARARYTQASTSRLERLKRFLLTGFLHQLQPLARLIGRASYGLTPWRRRKAPYFAFPRPRNWSIWGERWVAAEDRLLALEEVLREQGAIIQRGGDFDRWDLEVRGGLFGVVRILFAIEEHGGGRQMVRLRSWPVVSRAAFAVTALFASLAVLAFLGNAPAAAGLFGVFALLMAIRTFGDCAAASAFKLFSFNVLHDQEKTANQPEKSPLCEGTPG